MENLGEKSGKKEILVGVWLREKEEKNLVGLMCFLLKPNKIFSPQNREKTERKSLICLIEKMTICTWVLSSCIIFIFIFKLLLS